MRALDSQELNPMIMEDIKSNARLGLYEDPETNIWSYYSAVKLTPIVLQDYLMLILTLPLVDQSLQMINVNFNSPSCRPISSDEFI